MSNAFELREQRPGHVSTGRDGHSLFLDGLQYGSKELGELRKLIVAYDKRDNIQKIRLQDNGLSDVALQDVTELIDLCPYLQVLDLRKNRFTEEAMLRIESHLRQVLNGLEVEKAALNAELEYIKREDMLDETGRTKPILIESNESKLVERLQINEFLFSAQQARNPVPMLIEKVSHILELLHTAQGQGDQYLQDLQRSNQMLTAMREKNMILYERTQMCETWKMRALLKIVPASDGKD